MAAAVLTPRVRIMAVCDGVRESTTEAGVFHLKGVRQGLIANSFPVGSRLWLFLVLSSPRAGEYPGYVRVINNSSEKTIFYGKLAPRPTFEANDEFLPALARIKCSFPEAGRYTIQVWFFQAQGNDVLKGELPFSIVKAGD
jgi:hypothetical protein